MSWRGHKPIHRRIVSNRTQSSAGAVPCHRSARTIDQSAGQRNLHANGLSTTSLCSDGGRRPKPNLPSLLHVSPAKLSTNSSQSLRTRSMTLTAVPRTTGTSTTRLAAPFKASVTSPQREEADLFCSSLRRASLFSPVLRFTLPFLRLHCLTEFVLLIGNDPDL